MAYLLAHNSQKRVLPGERYPLGATVRPGGVNFAVYSQHATDVFVLLFDDSQSDPTDIIRLPSFNRRVWHGFVEGIGPGQLYGLKVRGEYAPRQGLRFNDSKLLVDPYAKALATKAVNTGNLLLAYDPLAAGRDLIADRRDNTHIVPKAIVVDDTFDWQNDCPPDIPWEQSFIYEVHCKGFTAHCSSGVANSGTYLGFVEKIPYLKSLGITAVELLPVHDCYVEDFLRQRGLTNYWGYNTLAFFAPELAYSTQTAPGCQVNEFKTLVRELHRAGIEVILDVVYNHSAEGSELGPTLSLRGIDNLTYYALCGGSSEPNRYYENYTGCGNSLNLMHPQVIRLVMDSLRYWAQTMHVDGFRFDLASVLGRRNTGFENTASFFDTVSQDPVLSRVKLIAEPWDISTYQVGNFPIDWSEWNGRFRDTMRKFARGDRGQLRDLGFRVTGSADLYGDDGRSAYNSVNFITCHDGFTLCDLVSYSQKHNENNGEDNRDGTDDNNSWNCGAEGDTSDTEVNRMRRQIAKNHVCHLLCSLGTPMLLGGDEMLRTQHGNNNAYCHDDELAWFDWELCDRNREFVEFVRKAIAFNKRHSILHRRRFFCGEDCDDDGTPDISWFSPDGGALDWDDPELGTVCYRIDGSEEPSDWGEYLLFFILNADWCHKRVALPPCTAPLRWRRVVDTSLEAGEDFVDIGESVPIEPADYYYANPRSTVILIGR